MTALGYALQDLMGTSTLIFGGSVTPTSPASLSVLVNPGRIYTQAPLEPSAWSSLPANSMPICKQGSLTTAMTLACPAPPTSGFSIAYLIEGQYQENDIDLATLSYWNASNPQQPWSGAGNFGIAQPTRRAGQFVVQVKAGTQASTGTQVAPAVDAGWIALATVTVANGSSSITSGNIVASPTAPYTSPPAQSISGSFVLTGVGFSGTAPSGNVIYRINGNEATLILPASSFFGTSNSTNFSATGLPTVLQPALTLPTQFLAVIAQDNGSSIAGATVVPGAGSLTFAKLGNANWTASGTKGASGSISYLLS
jgi:hypothetical protein